MKRSTTNNQNIGDRLVRHAPVVIMGTAVFVSLSVLAFVSLTQRPSAFTALFFALLLLVCVVLAIAVVQILTVLNGIKTELWMIRTAIEARALDDIAADLTAMRTQMAKGVFGLLGM